MCIGRNILMRFDATYTVTSRTADVNNQLLRVGQASGPVNTDSKYAYNGVNSWFHIVLFRDDADSNCPQNIQAPNLASMSASDITKTILFNSDPTTQPININRPKF
jgi:hypothetical protein